MIVFGWGGKLKKVCDAGISKCPNCRNYSPHFIGKVSKAVRLYWVPVVPYSTKHYIVCSVCEGAVEIPAEKVGPVTAKAMSYCPNDKAVPMLARFRERMARALTAGADVETAASAAVDDLLKAGVPKEHAGYICAVYLAFLCDDDTPQADEGRQARALKDAGVQAKALDSEPARACFACKAQLGGGGVTQEDGAILCGPCDTRAHAPSASPLPAFYFSFGGKRYGPADLALVGHWIEQGRVTPDSLAWATTMQGSEWVPAGQVPGLARLFAKVAKSPIIEE